MNFYICETDFSLNKKTFGKDFRCPRPIEWYNRYLREITPWINSQYATPSARLLHKWKIMAEQMWYVTGCTYYKVWPAYFDALVRTKLDVPASLFKIPHSVFAVRLPASQLLTWRSGNHFYEVRSLFAFGCDQILDQQDKKPISKDVHQFAFSARISIDGKPPRQNFMKYSRRFDRADQTVEECLGSLGDLGNGKIVMPASIVEACSRLIIGVCFMAVGGHKVLEYDVLDEHLEAYRSLHTGHPDRQRIELLSKEKGNSGWNIGRGETDRCLQLPNGVTYDEAIRTAGGHHLLYQHTRGTHFRLQRYGPQNSLVKVIQIRETVVRPDLPAKPLILP